MAPRIDSTPDFSTGAGKGRPTALGREGDYQDGVIFQAEVQNTISKPKKLRYMIMLDDIPLETDSRSMETT